MLTSLLFPQRLSLQQAGPQRAWQLSQLCGCVQVCQWCLDKPPFSPPGMRQLQSCLFHAHGPIENNVQIQWSWTPSPPLKISSSGSLAMILHHFANMLGLNVFMMHEAKMMHISPQCSSKQRAVPLGPNWCAPLLLHSKMLADL